MKNVFQNIRQKFKKPQEQTIVPNKSNKELLLNDIEKEYFIILNEIIKNAEVPFPPEFLNVQKTIWIDAIKKIDVTNDLLKAIQSYFHKTIELLKKEPNTYKEYIIIDPRNIINSYQNQTTRGKFVEYYDIKEEEISGVEPKPEPPIRPPSDTAPEPPIRPPSYTAPEPPIRPPSDTDQSKSKWKSPPPTPTLEEKNIIRSRLVPNLFKEYIENNERMKEELKQFIRENGIPNKYRKDVWKKLILTNENGEMTVPDAMPEYEEFNIKYKSIDNLYQNYIKKYFDVIDNDTKRNRKFMEKFFMYITDALSEQLDKSSNDLLKSWIVLDPSHYVKYTQGLNFWAYLLLYMYPMNIAFQLFGILRTSILLNLCYDKNYGKLFNIIRNIQI